MTDSSGTKKKGLDRLETVAIAVSSAVIGAALIYWTIQISGVMEMLEMAYG
jgi:hypothetical protein